MSLFLQIVSVETALKKIGEIVQPVTSEVVPLAEAYGRVLAEDTAAKEDIPGFHRSIVDGFAVIASDTTGATEAIPAMIRKLGRVEMGELPKQTVISGTCIVIPTGAVLPEGADAAVMAEYTEESGDLVLIHRPVAPGENVLRRGEDFTAGQTVMQKGRRLSPQDLGVLAALGMSGVRVSRRPVIGVISTGNEVIPVGASLMPGRVRDVNTYLCTGFLQRQGCIPRSYGIVRDDPEIFARTLADAATECDAVFISGGSSKDVRDLVSSVIANQGEVLIHGIGIQPGKPTIIGKVSGKAVIGLPGHPASAFIVLTTISIALVNALTGGTVQECRTTVRLGQNIPSPRGRVDYVRVRVSGGVATPLFGKSGLLNTLIESSGVIRIGAECEGLEAGEMVDVIRW